MIEKIRGQIREFVRQWRIRRAANAWRRHHAAMKRAKHTYRALTSEPERLGLPEIVERLAIAATPYVPEVEVPTVGIFRRCAAAMGAVATEYVSITRLTGRRRGRHYAARSAARASASPRSTERPEGAHTPAAASTVERVGRHRARVERAAAEVVEATHKTTRRVVHAVGDLTGGGGRRIRRHYAPRSWGFDNHRSRLWSIADGWAATA